MGARCYVRFRNTIDLTKHFANLRSLPSLLAKILVIFS